MLDAHIVTCRQWFDYLKTGMPPEFRQLVYQLPNIDLERTILWASAMQLDANAAVIWKKTGTLKTHKADFAFSKYIKSFAEGDLLSVAVLRTKENASEIAKERFRLDATFKSEYYSANHIKSEFPKIEKHVEAFVFFCFDFEIVSVAPTAEVIFEVRKQYDSFFTWLLDRALIFAPTRQMHSEERDYFKEFYTVKANLNVDITIDKTSVYEYYTLLEILKNQNEN